MRYAIVTPTICRPSLLRLCESVDGQVQTDWEHLVIVDLPRQEMTQSQQGVLRSISSSANRSIFFCDKRHNNYGHTCRYQAWERVKGEYILYVDDDDYLADSADWRPWMLLPNRGPCSRFSDMARGFFACPPAPALQEQACSSIEKK